MGPAVPKETGAKNKEIYNRMILILKRPIVDIYLF
jgi:hypothetical protein